MDRRVWGEVFSPSSQKQYAFTGSIRGPRLRCLCYEKDCQAGELAAECMQCPSCLGRNLINSTMEQIMVEVSEPLERIPLLNQK